jgi:tRNA (cmo5U34)-methyltransferase
MSVRDTFDRLAAEYDTVKQRIIPGYGELRAAVDRWADAGADDPGELQRVLELGCGTGSWAVSFLERHPRAELVALEFSAGMREVAASGLERFGTRARVIDMDLNDGLPDGRFDLVTSTLAIHHVRDKARLVREIYEHLVPGGRFVWADLIDPAAPELRTLFRDSWAAFMRSNDVDEASVQAVFADHDQNDLPEPLDTQLGYLRDSGFELATVVWRRELMAVCYGRRPA